MSKRPVARHSDGIPAGFDGNVKRQHASSSDSSDPSGHVNSP